MCSLQLAPQGRGTSEAASFASHGKSPLWRGSTFPSFAFASNKQGADADLAAGGSSDSSSSSNSGSSSSSSNSSDGDGAGDQPGKNGDDAGDQPGKNGDGDSDDREDDPSGGEFIDVEAEEEEALTLPLTLAIAVPLTTSYHGPNKHVTVDESVEVVDSGSISVAVVDSGSVSVGYNAQGQGAVDASSIDASPLRWRIAFEYGRSLYWRSVPQRHCR